LVSEYSDRYGLELLAHCPMDRNHTLMATRYVEQNPVRAGLVPAVEEYKWSSAARHTGKRVDPLFSDRHGWLSGVGDWTEWLHKTDDVGDLTVLRLRTTTGRPFGSAAFTEKVTATTGRPLLPRRRGHPRGKGASSK
jgi:putative transposase